MNEMTAALREARTQHGDSLAEAAGQSPLLLVFLRHFGCALCREMVADVARHRGALEASGTRVVFVHMHPETMAGSYFAEYQLGDALRVSDPDRRLYTAFGLEHASPSHWLSWSTLRRYIDAIFRGGHRPGYVGGNVLQLPGAFLIRGGTIAKAFRPAAVSHRFDVLAFIG